jgi:hypothetical protein
MATPNLTSITSVLPFVASLQLASGDNALYTVGASKAAKIKPLILTNTSGTATVTVSVSVVPSGGTVDGTHKVVHAYALDPKETAVIDEIDDQWLPAGAVVSVNADTAATVDATLTGIEFT